FERWWEAYQDNSALHRVLEQTGLLFGAQPAAADGAGLAERVTEVRIRSLDLATFATTSRGVPVLFALQAARGVPGDGGAYRSLDAGRLPHGTEDLARTDDLRGALDAVTGEVYLDGVLTNEAGARVVARALWPAIDDALEATKAGSEASPAVGRGDPMSETAAP
ncbi:MAG: hypothetical protein KDB35_23780, partial [Acidimicrobiales bacterium]|nr:hypothetical protein [Acidimicrobiales bacterium]